MKKPDNPDKRRVTIKLLEPFLAALFFIVLLLITDVFLFAKHDKSRSELKELKKEIDSGRR